MVRMLRNILREPLKTMFLEVGVCGESPHIALLLFAEKQKGRFLEIPINLLSDHLEKVGKINNLVFENHYPQLKL